MLTEIIPVDGFGRLPETLYHTNSLPTPTMSEHKFSPLTGTVTAKEPLQSATTELAFGILLI